MKIITMSRIVVLAAVAACSGLLTASPSQAGNGPDGPYIATISVVNEQFKVQLKDEGQVRDAFANMAGDRTHVNGKVLPGTDVNKGWNWHLDPTDLKFVQASIEVCDGLPSDVEAQTITSDRYCPWSARVIAMTEMGPETDRR